MMEYKLVLLTKFSYAFAFITEYWHALSIALSNNKYNEGWFFALK